MPAGARGRAAAGSGTFAQVRRQGMEHREMLTTGRAPSARTRLAELGRSFGTAGRPSFEPVDQADDAGSRQVDGAKCVDGRGRESGVTGDGAAAFSCLVARRAAITWRGTQPIDIRQGHLGERHGIGCMPRLMCAGCGVDLRMLMSGGIAAMRQRRTNRERKAHRGKRERLQQQLEETALAHGDEDGLHPEPCQRDLLYPRRVLTGKSGCWQPVRPRPVTFKNLRDEPSMATPIGAWSP
jgi:hypothetical protein